MINPQPLQAFDLLVYKENNEGHKVLYINILNREFVFRTLGKKEYKNILNVTSNEFDLEDMVCQVGLLYPEDFDWTYSQLNLIRTEFYRAANPPYIHIRDRNK
jgi:C1A family cysteine protease